MHNQKINCCHCTVQKTDLSTGKSRDTKVQDTSSKKKNRVRGISHSLKSENSIVNPKQDCDPIQVKYIAVRIYLK